MLSKIYAARELNIFLYFHNTPTFRYVMSIFSQMIRVPININK